MILFHLFCVFFWIFGFFYPVNGVDINYDLTQPQIYIEDGHIYIIPAKGRNLVLLSNGDGKIMFDTHEMRGLVSSIRNSSRDLESFKRIFGNPANASAGLSQRVQSLEQTLYRLNLVDNLDQRLTNVERQLIVGGNQTGDAPATPSRGRNSLTNRIRRLRNRIDAIEARLNSGGVISEGGTGNPCNSNPCSNGGACIPTPFGPFCSCRDGWEGPNCDQDVNECANFAGTELGCQNQATCVNTPGSYSCNCRPGWIGLHCTKRSGDCSSGPSWELCGHGTCVNQHSGSRPFTCICEQGWTTDRSNPACSIDINECESGHALCSSNPPVSCINTPGSYMCGPCPPGFTGNGHRCLDVNECLVGNGGCSVNPMVQCVNTQGGRTCGECPPGYMGNGIVCQYVGMCGINNGGCHPMARCMENPVIGQSFVQCLCPQGTQGSGMGPQGCVPIGGLPGPGPGQGPLGPNPCIPSPCYNGGVCQGHGNAFTCLCFNGFSGPTCAVRSSPCGQGHGQQSPCQNGGTCLDAPGTNAGFYCRCTDDFTGDRCQQQVESCGGVLTNPSGILRYPHTTAQQETYSDNANCIWLIRTDPGKVINITFTRFHLEGYPGSRCVHDSLTFRDGYDIAAPVFGRYCGDELPNGGNLLSTHEAFHITFASDHSIVGLGFEFEWNTTDPICGGLISNMTHGSINSPGYPGPYPHNRDCEWQIAVTPGKRIQLVFATFGIETHPNCSFDYLQVLDGVEDYSPLLSYYCNTTLPPPLVSSGPYLAIRFHTDSSANDVGFHITFAEVPGIPGCGGVLTAPMGVFSSPQHPEPYAHGLECDWIVRLPSTSDRVALRFNTFELEGSNDCVFDYVEIRDGPGPSAQLMGRFCGNSAPPEFKSTSNQLFIKFRSDESVAYGGFSAKYEAVCGGVFSDPEGMIRSPFYPGNYPRNRECVFLIEQPLGKGILLDFLDFDVESGVGERCYFDYVEVRDGDTENSTMLGHYCGTPEQSPERTVSTHNYLWIKFKTDGSIQNRGFLANYSTFDTGCGGIIRTGHGIISSPGHPEVYPHGLTCTWVLRGEPGQAVRLNWVSFSLETASSCSYDYVEVFDNSTLLRNGTSMGRYCGHNIPPVLTSSDNTMTIVFKSDHSVSHDGFMANFILINTSTVCGGDFFSEYGVIRSPRYPEFYPNRKSCEWVIRVATGRQIRLNISDFDLENGTRGNCAYDYIELRNGAYSSSPLIGKYCGNNLPPQLIPSFSNSLFIKFVSDYSHAGRGFLITWDGTATGCGGSLTSPTGAIVSPNYPMSYGANAECIWTVSANQGSSLQIVFVDLDIQHSQTCWGEYIEIRDGLDSRAPLIGKYCHSDSVLSVNTTSNFVWIKFLSGYGGTGRGFQLNYRASCSRIITGFHGVIESPNFPFPYPHNRNCTWEIQAPRGNKVNVSFSHFDVEGASRGAQCVYDFVELKERGQQDSADVATNSIGKFCGAERPPHITSSKDTLLINFVSDYSFAMNGFRLEWRVHGCGGRLFGSYNAIKSPNYPQKYGNNVYCQWHITTELGTKVRLNIYELDIERQENCAFDSLSIYGGPSVSSPLLTRLCHTSSSGQTVTSSGNNMFIEFKSDGSVPSRGFYGSVMSVSGGCGGTIRAPKGFVYSPNYPGNYDHNDDCGWLIEVDQNHVVDLQFLDFSIERHINCSYDHVAIYDGDSDSDPLLLTHCGSELPSPNFVKSSGSKMYIRLKTDGSSSSRGFKANFTQGCGARITSRSRDSYAFSRAFSDSKEITSPHYPSTIFSNTNCTWIISSPEPDEKVTLTFTALDMQTSSEPGCESAFVQVLDGEDSDAPSLGKFCGHTLPPSLTSRGSSLVLKLFTNDRTIGGFGFRAVYDFASSACGFTTSLQGQNGSFTSPNYPSGYPPNMECVWTIRVPEGNKVDLSFRAFSIEASDYCNSDFLEIHEGEDAEGRLLGHFCGNQAPTNISASAGLWILFRTDGEGQAPGFWGDYSLVHGNDLSGPFGIIESPGYPGLTSVTGTFTWRVTVNESQAILIAFTDVDFNNYVDEVGDCSEFIRIQIFDGFDSDSPEILKACSGQSLTPITSTGNTVFIQFVKPYWGGRFRLTWDEVLPYGVDPLVRSNITGCGGNFSVGENTTSLLSPYFPLNYPNNVRCVWTLNSPPHTRIQVQINALDLESSMDCHYDKVEFYDGQAGLPNYVLNRTLCLRSQVNGTLLSSGRFLQIVFTTDGSDTMPGFNFSLTAVCGGYSREPRGKITSPGYPGMYHPAICEWTIIVRPGRTIQTFFEFFDIYSDGSECVTDEIIVRNGGGLNSPFLGAGRYCGSSKPSLPETSGNMLHLSFRAWTSNRRGFSLLYEEVSAGCGGEIYLTNEANSVTISSPNFPQIPPPFTECEWLVSAPQGEAVQLTFQISFDFDTAVSGCEKAGVELRDGGTQLSRLIGRFCTSMPGTLKSTGNIMYIKYYTDVPEPRTGFKAEVKIATCGGLATGWIGRIQSPGYPQPYGQNLDCLWTIRTSPGTFISLRFQDVDIGGQIIPVLTNDGNATGETGCSESRDRIYISEPTYADSLFPRNWTICSLSRFGLLSSGNELSIRFISDSSRDTDKKGFKMSYTARNEMCGGTLRTPTGIIQTPNYPNNYPHYRHCTWRIIAPEDRRVRLQFEDFDLEETYTAEGRRFCYDSVSVYQGLWRDLPRLYNKTLCGPALPAPVETTQNVMVLNFASDNSVAHRGFRARYSTDLERACGGRLPASNGTLTAPNVTTGTPETTTNTLCHWKTEEDSQPTNTNGSSSTFGRAFWPRPRAGSYHNGTTIVTINSIRIPPWDVPLDPSCPSGFLHITPGDDAFSGPGSGGNWRKWCGSMTNVKVYIPGKVLKIEYETPFKESNFSVEWKVSPCGEKLTGPLDNVSSVGYPSGYPVSTECIWILEYGYSAQIRVKFLDLDIEDNNDPGCGRDYVLIRNGKYQTSPVLGKFCGSNIPPDIISMSSHLWIEFHSDDNPNSGRRGFKIQTEKVERGCGGILHRKFGKIRSPTTATSGGGDRWSRPSTSSSNSGRYPPNTECEWIIETVPGYTLNLFFEGRFDLEQSPNCSHDYVEIAVKTGSEEVAQWEVKGKYCGRQLPPEISTKSTKVKVRFVSNANLDGNGFGLVWWSPCGGVVTESTGVIRSAHYDRLNHSQSLNTENYWSLVGYESSWKIAECFYTIQGASEQDYVVAEFLSPFDISVPASFGARVSEVNAECPEVNVTIWEGNTTHRMNPAGPYCGPTPPQAFVGRGSVTLGYNYRPSYQNEGFRLKYSIFKCGGEVTQPLLLSSPGHPFTSAPHMNCTWTISAPVGKVVRFRFESLELEFHSQCEYDFVKLYDSAVIKEDKLLGTFCGNMTQDLHPFLSSSRQLTIQFSTDWSIQHAGFSGAVDFTPKCGGMKNVSQEQVTLSSVDSNSDGSYDPDLDCQWVVTGPPYQSLEISFQSFNLEGGVTAGSGKNASLENCPYDYLEIRDGPGPFAELLGRLCGSISTLPSTVSSSNWMWIRFVSDSSYNFPGFGARVVSKPSPCGQTLVLNATREPGQLSSPSYPSPYPPNTRCKWTLDGATFFDEVDIKFVDMDIAASEGCKGDRLEIRDVSTSYTSPEGFSGPVLFIGHGAVDWRHRNLNLAQEEILQDVRYCGGQTPPDFFSVGRSVDVIFHSSSSSPSGRGFKIEYKASGCNRTFEGGQGRIFSPEFPGYTPIFSNCLFSVRAQNGSTISLYFNKFLLPGAVGGTECVEAGMEIRDGSPSGRLLGKFCGSSRPSSIFSFTNVLWVRYFSRVELSRGYDISYTTTSSGRGCGGELFHTGGSFTSPMFPSNYSIDSDCRWRVRVPSGLAVEITFPEFLISGGNCSTDFLEIYSLQSHSPSPEGPTLFSRFCPGDTISTYTGQTDSAEVRYRTSRGNGGGWRAEFKGVTPSRLPPQSIG